MAARQRTALLGVHSFTPRFLGIERRWHAGVLYRQATAFGRALVARLTADRALVVGDNEPYRVTLETDYTVPVHGDRRRIDAALIEVRQDLLTTDEGVEAWASRLSSALSDLQGPA